MYHLLIIRLALDFVKETIKNPAHAAEFRQILLDLRDSINDLFPPEDK